MVAHVARAAVKLQLDVHFGDPVTPAPVQISYPALRAGDPPVHVMGYPLATVLAEKRATEIDLGAGNSRVRDYADVWTLTRKHDLAATELLGALEATSDFRGTRLRPLAHVGADLGTARQATHAASRRQRQS